MWVADETRDNDPFGAFISDADLASFMSNEDEHAEEFSSVGSLDGNTSGLGTSATDTGYLGDAFQSFADDIAGMSVGEFESEWNSGATPSSAPSGSSTGFGISDGIDPGALMGSSATETLSDAEKGAAITAAVEAQMADGTAARAEQAIGGAINIDAGYPSADPASAAMTAYGTSIDPWGGPNSTSDTTSAVPTGTSGASLSGMSTSGMGMGMAAMDDEAADLSSAIFGAHNEMFGNSLREQNDNIGGNLLGSETNTYTGKTVSSVRATTSTWATKQEEPEMNASPATRRS